MSSFSRARRAALIGDLLRILRQQPVDLLSFDEIKERLRLRSLADRGLQEVPVERIVGSLGRAREFNRAFLPREESLRDRWQGIEALAEGPVGFPPIDLYKVGDAYFVVDGHHRLSVARRSGAETIEARVKEFQTPVPVSPDDSAEEVIAKAGLADFLAATGLEPRDGGDLVTSIGDGYERLLDHISVHRYFLGQQLGQPVEWGEAARHWYHALYRPVVELVAASGVCDHFPSRTAADLYLFAMDHLHRLRQLYGDSEVGPAAAVEALSRAKRRERRLGSRLRRWFEEEPSAEVEDETGDIEGEKQQAAEPPPERDKGPG